MNPELSIIVPVFQAEKYLEECIDSILKQTFENFELILVDDGSWDASPKLCDAWAQKDQRVLVIHQSNGGPAAAVLRGIQASQGRYLGFVDSDDWVEPEMFASLYQKAVQEQADMVQCGFYQHTSTEKKPKNVPDGVWEKSEIEKLLLPAFYRNEPESSGFWPCRWNKLFRKEIVLQNLSFCPAALTSGEDYLLVLACLSACKKVASLNSCGYHYRCTQSSLTRHYSVRYRENQEIFWSGLKSIAKAYGYESLLNLHGKDRGYLQAMLFAATSSESLSSLKQELKLLYDRLENKKVLWSSLSRQTVGARLFFVFVGCRCFGAAAFLGRLKKQQCKEK